ncbi:MAG: glycoside hydrolase family 25 protein [Lachnospiraceae bacterium]|nr:glycoside hydrolase family 25 protein [Lachnospiraceae bacterium]
MKKNIFISLLIIVSVLCTSCKSNQTSSAGAPTSTDNSTVSADTTVSGDTIASVSDNEAASTTVQDDQTNASDNTVSETQISDDPRIKTLRHSDGADLSELSSMAYHAMFNTLCNECRLPYDRQNLYDEKYGSDYFKNAIKRFTIEDVDDDGFQEFILAWRAKDTKDMMGVVYSYSDYTFKWSLKREGILIRYEDYADVSETSPYNGDEADDDSSEADDRTGDTGNTGETADQTEDAGSTGDSDNSDDKKENKKEKDKDALPYIELAHPLNLEDLYRLSADNADALIKLKDGTLSPEDIHVFRDVAGNSHIEILNQDANPVRISSDVYRITDNGIEITGTKHRLGIDVSFYQDDVDFEKVKNSGIDFVFVRAGFRGYGTGSLNEDSKAVENIKNALTAGLDVGVYFFSQAINEKEAVEEAEYVFDILEKAGITSPEELKMPIVFDPESIMNDSARTDGVTGEQFTLNSIAFCETVKEKGYDPCVYCNMLWQAFKLDLGILKDYKIWYADYEELPQTPYDYTYWQYSDTGSVDGVKGPVDLDIEILYD